MHILSAATASHAVFRSLLCAGALCALTTFSAQAQRRTPPATTDNMGTTAPINAPTPPPAQTGLNYRNPAADERIPMEAAKRDAVAKEMQATVAELLELYHDAKQSHWNLRGPLYYQLHEVLQEYAETYLKYTDIMAERALQVGRPIDGRTGVIAATADLGGYPGGFLEDRQVLDLMSSRVDIVAKRVRERIERVGKIDETTSNLLQELSHDLDKQAWQLRVTQQ
ncbi:Dps family protein [Hymenobacter actinosclerus]|uniref:Starvation-inducible DNA-binding protein n=1 Tax=Hymenobacter actinosclerus TaxID=82805 RepID=A0A1I0DRA2_9BACT|nr:DNA starvation/stationary phase protection protein [Hymenobacter actinosclerus]SET34456.1 starvation-inducible DNA-binding protein [Hymenobacter actinosclerus]